MTRRPSSTPAHRAGATPRRRRWCRLPPPAAWDPLQRLEGIAGPEERLRRHTCPIAAFAADELVLDDPDPKTATSRDVCGVLASGSSADHQHVIAGVRLCAVLRARVAHQSPGFHRWSRASRNEYMRACPLGDRCAPDRLPVVHSSRTITSATHPSRRPGSLDGGLPRSVRSVLRATPPPAPLRRPRTRASRRAAPSGDRSAQRRARRQRPLVRGGTPSAGDAPPEPTTGPGAVRECRRLPDARRMQAPPPVAHQCHPLGSAGERPS